MALLAALVAMSGAAFAKRGAAAARTIEKRIPSLEIKEIRPPEVLASCTNRS